MTVESVVVVAAKRTPIGAFQGVLAGAPAHDLGAAAIAGAIADSGIDAADVDQVLMGCVLPAGLGQAPARQAAIKGGILPRPIRKWAVPMTFLPWTWTFSHEPI